MIDYKRIQKFEKFFEERFNEDIHVVPLNKKNARDIKEEENKDETEEMILDGFTLEKPKRKMSMFNEKCKHCNKSIVKRQDQLSFLKRESCYVCDINFEEAKTND